MQNASQCEYEKRIHGVLNYIHDHFSEDLSIDDLARISCFSPYHFHRLFTALVGESVGAYQRRIRLEKANHMLRFNPSKSISEIALDTGFNSPGAFNRAFKNHFHCKPSEVRFKKRKRLNDSFQEEITFPPFIIDHSIERRQEKRLFYRSYVGPYGDDYVSNHWCEHIQDALSKNLITENTSFIGVIYDDPDITDDTRCRYDCGITVDSFVHHRVKKVSGGIYALFDFKGSCDEVFKAYRWIYGQWFPQSGYEPENLPPYEEYCHFKINTPIMSNVFHYTICIPVVKL